jgi:lysophospholipase L1-like esterase
VTTVHHRAALALLASVTVLLGACQTAASPSASVLAEQSTASSPSPQASTEPAGLHLVTIGDSIPYGQEDCGGCLTFTTLFAQAVEQGAGPVSAQNLSTHDGLTGKRLVERIRTDEPMRTAVSGADIVVVNIGHNDTPWNSTDDACDGANAEGVFNWTSYTGDCVPQLAQRHGEELDAILTEIEELRAGRPTAIRVLTDYNDIIGWDQAPPESTEPSVEVLDAFHAETCQAAEAHGAICVDVYHSFNGPDGRTAAGDLLAGDYTHPSAKGQVRIAALLTAAGLAPVSS